MNRRYRKTVIAGNWKMNMTATEPKKFAEELKKIIPMIADLRDAFTQISQMTKEEIEAQAKGHKK